MNRSKRLLLILFLLYKKLRLHISYQQHRQQKRRRYRVHPLNQRRENLGVYSHLIREIRSFDNHHRRYLRITAENFDRILSLVSPMITRRDTRLRKAVEPGLKLAVTLHHLAEGASHSSIALHYRLGRSTTSNIIYETCDAVWKVLQPLYLKMPAGSHEWTTIAKG